MGGPEEWLANNRISVLLVAAFLALHLRGHGGCGTGEHGGHRHAENEDDGAPAASATRA